MNSLLLILIICFLGGKFKVGETQILNGFDLEQRAFNYHVSIIGNNTYRCAGGIVNENYVITAAHCVERFEGYELFIIAGVKYLRDPEAVVRLVERKFIPLEYYSADRRYHDVAGLKLHMPLVLGENIGAITLPIAPQSADNVTTCLLTGVERSSIGPGIYGKKLSWLQLMLMPNDICECKLQRRVDPSLLCATPVEENEVTHVWNHRRDYCKGDSGSVLICDGVAVGILKGGRGYIYVFGRIYDYEYVIRKLISSE